MRNYLYLIIFLLLYSCQKDPGPVPDSRVIIGDYSNMIVRSFDTIIVGGYQRPNCYNLDVNDDSKPDFQLISDIWGSPGLGQNPHARIVCLHSNAYLLGILKNDTSFLNRSQRILPGANNSVMIYNYSNFTCHRIAKQDSVLKINTDVFKVSAKNKNEVISYDAIFKADTIILTDDWYSYPTQLVSGYGTDTVTYQVTTFYNDCNSFPLDEIKYIGYKLTKDNQERLGWLKICIIDKYKIVLLESALQKKQLFSAGNK